MSTIALSGGLNRAYTFYDSVIGKKIVMAVTGFILFGYVLAHMLGNLQVFLPPGPDGIPRLDHYAQQLRAVPPLPTKRDHKHAGKEKTAATAAATAASARSRTPVATTTTTSSESSTKSDHPRLRQDQETAG